MRTATLMLTVVVVLLSGCATALVQPHEAADFEAGKEAYYRGDYDTALKEWRPLAEQGFASAQNNLAKMYRRGEGVPKDDVLAHMWWSLAAAQGHEPARKYRDRLAARMTPAQLADAQRLAREWKPKQ